MTHPTYHAAVSAALVDLADRLRTGRPHGYAVSGPHAYDDDGTRRLVTVRLGAVLDVDDSTAEEQVDWLAVDADQRVTPGWPLDEERAAWDLWLDGADVD